MTGDPVSEALNRLTDERDTAIDAGMLAAKRCRSERDRADKAEAERDVLAAKLARVEKVLVPYMVANGVRPDDPPVEIQRIHIRASEIRAALRSDR